MASATKTDPELRERVKQEITGGDKGGEPGQWSARKAQMAVREYKCRGGGYEDDGTDQEDTDDDGRAKGGAAALRAKTKDELHEMARERAVEGRSSMDEDELVEALREDG